MGVVMRFSGGTAEVLPTPAPCFTLQPPSSSMSSTGQRPWRMCSWRTAGRTPRSCGRSLAAPRESLATIQVGTSPSPQSAQHPTPSTSPHLILGVWEGMVTLSISGWPGPLLQGLLPGPGTSLPVSSPPSHLLSFRSYAVASPQENRPVRCPQETLVSEHGGVGQGHPLSSPARPPPSQYPGLRAGRSQLYPIFISHIVATGKWIPSPRQSSQLPLPSSTARLSTLSGLRDWAHGGSQGGYVLCRVGQPLPYPFGALDTPTPLPSSPAVLHGLIPCHLFNPLRSYDSLPLASRPRPGEMTSH